jgi:hypothetical protein
MYKSELAEGFFVETVARDGNPQIFPCYIKELYSILMFVSCILDVVEMTNNMQRLCHYFMLYTGSYMFRQ